MALSVVYEGERTPPNGPISDQNIADKNFLRAFTVVRTSSNIVASWNRITKQQL
jgi:hypothetical protein